MSRRRTKRRMVGRRLVNGESYVVWRYEPDEVAQAVGRRTHPRQNAFDQSWMQGRYPAWVRNQGHTERSAFGDGVETAGSDGWEPRPIGYNRPAAEEPYVEALGEFFDTRIALMPPKARQDLSDVKARLRAVMLDKRSYEDQAKDLGVSKQAVQQAQARAVDQLVESCGGKAALAEKLRQFLFDKELQDGRERLKFLPRWVHG